MGGVPRCPHASSIPEWHSTTPAQPATLRTFFRVLTIFLGNIGNKPKKPTQPIVTIE